MSALLKRVLLWPAMVVLLCLAAIGALGLITTIGALPNLSLFNSKSEARNTQVINSVTRVEQVALLSLGIQGIENKQGDAGTFLWMDIPRSERASFIQYGFNAKLGIDGQDVEIEQTGEDSFLISVPEFVFIGYDDVTLNIAAVDNDVLSWTTPEIDTVGMINKILSDDEQEKYISSNREILRDQAKAFYTGIVTSLDSATVVEFEFQN